MKLNIKLILILLLIIILVCLLCYDIDTFTLSSDVDLNIVHPGTNMGPLYGHMETYPKCALANLYLRGINPNTIGDDKMRELVHKEHEELNHTVKQLEELESKYIGDNMNNIFDYYNNFIPQLNSRWNNLSEEDMSMEFDKIMDIYNKFQIFKQNIISCVRDYGHSNETDINEVINNSNKISPLFKYLIDNSGITAEDIYDPRNLHLYGCIPYVDLNNPPNMSENTPGELRLSSDCIGLSRQYHIDDVPLGNNNVSELGLSEEILEEEDEVTTDEDSPEKIKKFDLMLVSNAYVRNTVFVNMEASNLNEIINRLMIKGGISEGEDPTDWTIHLQQMNVVDLGIQDYRHVSSFDGMPQMGWVQLFPKDQDAWRSQREREFNLILTAPTTPMSATPPFRIKASNMYELISKLMVKAGISEGKDPNDWITVMEEEEILSFDDIPKRPRQQATPIELLPKGE